MSAVTMIFEITLATTASCCNDLGRSRQRRHATRVAHESIYTLNSSAATEFVPKALHAICSSSSTLRTSSMRMCYSAPADMSFEAFLDRSDHRGRIRHVVVTEGDRILGVLRVNTRLRRASGVTRSGFVLRDVADRNFTIVREDDLVFEVIQRISRKQAMMAIVVNRRGVPRWRDVVGVITKEHVADSVASSVKVYPA